MADPSTSHTSSARTGALVFTGLSVLLAATGGWLLWRLLAEGGYNREPMRGVVVAAAPIGAGNPLRAEDLRIVPWPSSAVPAGSFAEIGPLVKSPPAVPTAGFVRGEPILRERLAAAEAGPGLSALVGKELRGVTVQVDRAMAAARLVYPGAHVDVIVTLEDKLHSTIVTRTVLEDVRVLAVGTFADVDAARRGAESSKNVQEAEAVVTLEVTPAGAEKLALCARQGKLDLSLRNAADRSRTSTPGIGVSEVVLHGVTGEPTAPSAAVAASPLAPPVARKHVSSSPSGAAPTLRSYPRQSGSDDNKGAGSTIEVYRVPTQAR